MKGIVFTEFLDMVEEEFGYETVHEIIVASEVESDGVYTSVGTYEFSELLALISNLSTLKKVEVPVLVKAFGKYLFHTFLKVYPGFFTRCKSSFEFLKSIDDHIHKEVRKLYSDAELPRFQHEQIGEDQLNLVYSSSRKLGDLAEGLIEETMLYFNDAYDLKKVPVNEDGSIIRFELVLKKHEMAS